MGNCCQAAQEGPLLEPLEPPEEAIEMERHDSNSESRISSRINSEDFWRNREEEKEVDNQIYQIIHTKDG